MPSPKAARRRSDIAVSLCRPCGSTPLAVRFEPLDARRLFAIGDLDATFAGGGFQSYTEPRQINAIVVQPDGKYLIGGTTTYGASPSVGRVLRVLAGGGVDTSFGSGGLTGAAGLYTVNDVAVQADGGIVAVGAGFNGVGTIARFNSAGTLLGTTTLTPSSGLSYDPRAVALGAAGEIYVDSQLTNEIVVTKLSAAGVVQTGWGNGGSSFINPYTGSNDGDVSNDIAVAADGRLFLVARAGAYGTEASRVYAIAANGFVDPSFGTGGYRTLFSPYASARDTLLDHLRLTADGKIVVGGTTAYTYNGGADSDINFLAVRLAQTGGAFDASFGLNGYVAANGGDQDQETSTDLGGAVSVQSDGKVILAGGSNEQSTVPQDNHFFLATARRLPNGTVDYAFGDNFGGETGRTLLVDGGYAANHFVYDQVLDGDGQIVQVGSLIDRFQLPQSTATRGLIVRSQPGRYPFTGVAPFVGPGGVTTIEAEDFDNGGPGIAYVDADPLANLAFPGAYGSAYRPGTGVDLERDSTTGPGQHVGYTHAGESLTYSVRTSPAGMPDVDVALRVASNGVGGTIRVAVDGTGSFVDVPVPNTGGFLNFVDVVVRGLHLAPNVTTLTLSMLGNGPSGFTGNVDRLRIGDLTAPAITAAGLDRDRSPQRFTFTFDEDVSASLGAGDLRVTLPGGGLVTAATVTWDAPTRTATFALAAPLPDGAGSFRLVAGGVTDPAGNAVVSTDTAYTYLQADPNGDGRTDFADLLVVAQNYGLSGRTFSQGNLNYGADGVVDFADLLILAQHYGAQALRADALELLTPASDTPSTAARRHRSDDADVEPHLL